jgi:flagellar protein FlbD
MIVLTRLSGTAFVLNADLIERLDSTPDTVVTLVDGKKYVVAEPMAEVVAMVRAYRADIIAQSTLMTDGAAGTGRVPHLVPVNEPPAATAESGKDA